MFIAYVDKNANSDLVNCVRCTNAVEFTVRNTVKIYQT